MPKRFFSASCSMKYSTWCAWRAPQLSCCELRLSTASPAVCVCCGLTSDEGLFHAHFGWLCKLDTERAFLDRANVPDLTSQFFYRFLEATWVYQTFARLAITGVRGRMACDSCNMDPQLVPSQGHPSFLGHGGRRLAIALSIQPLYCTDKFAVFAAVHGSWAFYLVYCLPDRGELEHGLGCQQCLPHVGLPAL